MTLADLKDHGGSLVSPVVSVAARLGLTPNQVSLLSFAVAVAAAAAFYVATTTSTLLGLALLLFSGLLDVVDGELARSLDVASRRGDMLDHTLDRYSDLVVLLGIAGGVDAWLLGAFALSGVLLTSYMGTQAQAVGAGRDYGGLMGRADRFAIVLVAGVLEALALDVSGYTAFEGALVLFAVVGNLTALQRFHGAWRELE
ncbi:MAG: CDP-alcohol phosphatidyltransferase family protein, partial [Halobacteriota archaeon]